MAGATARHEMPQSRRSRRGGYIRAGLAVGAAVALLAGGAGTFAAWNDSTTISGGTVNTGHLTITPDTTDAATTGWYDITQAANLDTTNNVTAPMTTDGLVNHTDLGGNDSPSVADKSTYRFAPGDVLEYYTTVDITAQGNNLTATLAAELTGDTALLADKGLSISVQFGDPVATGSPDLSSFTVGQGSIAQINPSADPASYKISTGTNKIKETKWSGIPVYVMLQMPADTAATAFQDESDVDLGTINLKLTQTL